MVGVLGRRAARRILRRDSHKTGRRGKAPTDDAAPPRRAQAHRRRSRAGGNPDAQVRR
ncbi:hypothetical protein SPHINGO8AM_50101 [Sphingomonas sp. 8AM]|nr:hypothetical protein SPHINGO8AM_50101 [Sphingomonas sp. 8AM]